MKITITDDSGTLLYEGVPRLKGNGIRIGSSETCEIQIKRLGISPEHVQLRQNAEGDLSLQDLQSAFGVMVNGKRIPPGFIASVPYEGAVVKLSDSITLHIESDFDATRPGALSGPNLEPTVFPFFLTKNERFVRNSFSYAQEKIPRQFHAPLRALEGEMTGKIRELSAILEVSYALNSILTFQRLLEFTIEMALAVTAAERGFITLQNEETGKLELVAYRRIAAAEIEKDMLSTSGLVNGCYQSSVGFAGPPPLDENDQNAVPPASMRGIRFLAVNPLKIQNTVLGVIYVDTKKSSNVFTARTLDLLSIFSAQASVAIHRAKLFHVATSDNLTGLSNQKHFHQRLMEEYYRSNRHGKPLSLLIMDLDGFAQINARYGTSGGDQILKKVGRIFRGATRVHDFVSRTGADEFTMLLPETPVEGAQTVAEKLKSLVEAGPFHAGKRSVRVTGSFGISSSVEKWSKPIELANSALKALEKARKAGGNKICISRETRKHQSEMHKKK